MESFFWNEKGDRKKRAGMGVIEIILIIVVLISLVLIFKSQLTTLVKQIFGKISQSALSV